MNDMFSASHIHKFARQLIYTRRHNLKPGKWNILKIKFEYFSQWCGSWSALYEFSLTSKSVSCHSFLAILDCKCFYVYIFKSNLFVVFVNLSNFHTFFTPSDARTLVLDPAFKVFRSRYRLPFADSHHWIYCTLQYLLAKGVKNKKDNLYQQICN